MMKIAHLLPHSAQFPLENYSGRYEWVPRLAELQIAQGHEVVIFAGPGSTLEGSRIVWQSTADGGVYKNKTMNNVALVETAFQVKSFDIYHSHFDYIHFFLGDLTEKPLIYTQHWRPSVETAKASRFNAQRNVLAVPPTNFMYQQNKELGVPSAETIYHGIDLELFSPKDVPLSDRLLFVGRVTPDKGVEEAIKIARDLNQKLDIVGRVKEKDAGYWQQLAPLVDGEQIRYLGPKTQAELAVIFSQAKALVFPTKEPEAFGLVTVEAQACGTPVVISDIGPSKELVDHGKSGFVVKTLDEFTAAIRNIDSIDRKYCRQFAQKFDIREMANHYDRLYSQLSEKPTAAPADTFH